MELSKLFYNCLHKTYIHTESGADYATERIGSVLYIYFEASNGSTDWKNNLNFPAKPYKRMNKTVWFAHRGFLRVWKSVENLIAKEILNPEVKKIVTVGYSHGAAVAVLCHEYIWYNRPDIRDISEGYGFGCPRVFWGILTKELGQRWANFTVIRNIDDIVTHAPPKAFGFSHVGKIKEIGTRCKYSAVDAHRAENIMTELLSAEGSESTFEIYK